VLNVCVCLLNFIFVIDGSITHFSQFLDDDVWVLAVFHEVDVVSGSPDKNCSELVALEVTFEVLKGDLAVLILIKFK